MKTKTLAEFRIRYHLFRCVSRGSFYKDWTGQTTPYLLINKNVNDEKKISGFFPFEMISIKSPAIDREDSARKKKAEAEKFLKTLKPGDLLVLFDEAGKTFKNSEAFASALQQTLERSPTRLVFLIGGAFGVDESIKEKAFASWSLSALTMNHWVAQLMALEQIYRGLTIIKKIPYHNR